MSLNGGMFFSHSTRRCYLPSGIVLKQVAGGKWVRSEDFLLQRFLPSFSRVHRVCSEATEIGLETLSDFHNICFSLGKKCKLAHLVICCWIVFCQKTDRTEEDAVYNVNGFILILSLRILFLQPCLRSYTEVNSYSKYNEKTQQHCFCSEITISPLLMCCSAFSYPNYFLAWMELREIYIKKKYSFHKENLFPLSIVVFFQQLSVFLVYPVKAGGRLHVWKSSFRSLNSEPEWQAVYIYIDEYHCVYKAVNFLQQHGTSYRANGRHPSQRLIAVGVPSTVTVMSRI